MTIESKLDALTAAINNLAAAYAGKQQINVPTVAAPAPVQQPAAPVVALAPAAPAMPPPPVFAMPVAAPAPAAPGAPFTDAKGLLGYVMESYKVMGPAKGAQIQTVLTGLGVANINDIKPEQYAALFAAVEALKAA